MGRVCREATRFIPCTGSAPAMSKASILARRLRRKRGARRCNPKCARREQTGRRSRRNAPSSRCNWRHSEDRCPMHGARRSSRGTDRQALANARVRIAVRLRRAALSSPPSGRPRVPARDCAEASSDTGRPGAGQLYPQVRAVHPAQFARQGGASRSSSAAMIRRLGQLLPAARAAAPPLCTRP
jgi:hypothetical protein